MDLPEVDIDIQPKDRAVLMISGHVFRGDVNDCVELALRALRALEKKSRENES